MFEKRGLSKAQFAQSGYDTSAYRFIETEGTFTATLDLKVWGDSMLKNFLTLEDGRKIIACTFHRENYLGMVDIPIGSVLEVTFKKAVKSGKIYIREVKVRNTCLIR